MFIPNFVRLFLTLIVANSILLSPHVEADESINARTAKIWDDARRLASSWYSDDVKYVVQPGNGMYTSPGGPIVIGKDFQSLLTANKTGDSVLIFGLLHEMWHLNQAKNTPKEYLDNQHRSSLECAADAHAAKAMAQGFLSELNATATDKQVGSIIERIDQIREIPKNFPTISLLDTQKHLHLNLKQRELAVLFGIMEAYNSLEDETSPNGGSIKSLRDIAASVSLTLNSYDSDKTIAEICIYVAGNRDSSALNRLHFMPLLGGNIRKQGSLKVYSEKYSVSNSGKQPIEYSFLILDGYAKKENIESPASYFVEDVRRVKMVVPAWKDGKDGVTEFLVESRRPRIDDKYEHLPLYTPFTSNITLDRADFVGAPEHNPSCFEDVKVPPNSDAERQLAKAIMIGRAALERFETVKSPVIGKLSSGPFVNYDYNFNLPTNTTGYIQMSEWPQDDRAYLYIYTGNEYNLLFDDEDDRDKALVVFNRMVALVEQYCKKSAGFEDPFKKEKLSLEIDNFTTGSSAQLIFEEPDSNDVYSKDLPIQVYWSINQRLSDW